jgi:hypothetical protein
MELGRRDAARRDKLAFEVPDQRRDANQAELLFHKRVSLRPCGYDALVQPLGQCELCSNPSKSLEMSRKAARAKFRDLQVFCKLQKAVEKHRTAFTAEVAGSIGHRPLRKSASLQVKCEQFPVRSIRPSRQVHQ